jgi:hypothetical protein
VHWVPGVGGKAGHWVTRKRLRLGMSRRPSVESRFPPPGRLFADPLVLPSPIRRPYRQPCSLLRGKS